MNLCWSINLSSSENCWEIIVLRVWLASSTRAKMAVWSCKYFSSPNLLSGLNRLGGTKTVLIKNIVKELVCLLFPKMILTKSCSFCHTFRISLYISLGVKYFWRVLLCSFSCWVGWAVDSPFEKESLDFFRSRFKTCSSSSTISLSIKNILLAPYFLTVLLSCLQFRYGHFFWVKLYKNLTNSLKSWIDVEEGVAFSGFRHSYLILYA